MNFDSITTREDLREVFGKVGLRSAMDIMVHSSMRGLGYVVNGALDVIDSLLDGVGEKGTIIMPAHTGQLTDPADWRHPAVPAEYVETIRNTLRLFDPKTTPVRNRGIIAQTFLDYPDVYRSVHPLNSVAARGGRAAYFTEIHELHEPEGLASPTGRLYGEDGYVLLIGVTLTSCTAVHLAEFIADVPYLCNSSVRVLSGKVGRENRFVRLERYPDTSEFFDKLLPDLRKKDLLQEVPFRSCTLVMFPLRPVIDLTVKRLQSEPLYLVNP